ncbi:MAG TPA: ABC transporter permease subunit [Candidatus Eisenbacteria bacterium]|nr:ABC transporter permease subunit [Candidatus Eisenbacteria bacterium]
MSPILVIARLTVHEAVRRRVLVAGLIGGAAFLALYATGFHFMAKDAQAHVTNPMQRNLLFNLFTLMGLYAANFLSAMAAVLLPLDSLPGEIASGVVQTVASKPVRRADIVLGKWLGYLVVVLGYVLLLTIGVLTIVRVRAGFTPPGLQLGIPLQMLEAVLLVSLSIAWGTRFSTITSGIAVFGLHGVAFIGNWVEQIGTILGNGTTRYVGTIASLIMPSESLWTLAASVMQPALMRDMRMSPFSPASVPSVAMIWWAVGYLVVALALGLRYFQRRQL